jgi:hypothetical protein
MRLAKTVFFLASAAALVGCGSSDNTCGDAGCLDGAIVTGPDAGADGPTLWGLSRDMNNYTVTAVTVASDGCMLSPGELMGMSVPANYVAATNTLSIGKSQGTPAMPAFGSGTVGANMATLTRDNQAGDPTDVTGTRLTPGPSSCSTTTSSRSTLPRWRTCSKSRSARR